MPPREAALTRFAVLGQLALREWSAYELARSMARTLRWFWPRAESGIYAEARRLETDGLITPRQAPAADGSRRQRTIYTITDRGREALSRWMTTTADTVQFMIEPFLRLHLARAGTLNDLRRAVLDAQHAADELLRTAVTVAGEFEAGQHLFQADLPFRTLLFEGLWGQGLALKRWALAAEQELSTWTDIDPGPEAEQQALIRLRIHLTAARSEGMLPEH